MAAVEARHTAADERGPEATFTKRWQLCAMLWKAGLEAMRYPPDHIARQLLPVAVALVRHELKGLGHPVEVAE